MALKKISPFRLSSLLRLQKNPTLALQLFQNPNPTSPTTKPYRYSLLSYDLIIQKLGKAKMFTEMEQLLIQMTHETRFQQSEIIFCNVITFYGRDRHAQKAIETFNLIPVGIRTVKSLNTLINMLRKCREFGKIKEICKEYGDHIMDVCSYNVLINVCCDCGELVDAWKLFDEMPKRGLKANAVTFATLISRLCGEGKVGEAFRVKEDMVKVYNVKPNGYVYTSLIKAMCKGSEVEKAFKLKEEMISEGIVVDAAVYTTLITGLFRSGRKGEVSGLLEEMRSKGCKPDTVTYNAMISGYCGEKDFESAFGRLKEMKEKGCKPDVISYNVIISGLCKDGKVREAMDLFEDMPRRDCNPDVVTYRTLLDGLCDDSDFDEAELILDEMLFKGHVPHVGSVNKLVSGLCRERKLKMLGSVLSSLAKRNVIDLDTWMMAISNVCNGDSLSKSFECLDILTMPEETY
ncbi:hypothetical protein ACHQM5_018343 [Ranunculus cassubicifolius]